MAFFSSLRKLAVNTLLLPVDIVRDVATMGGTLVDRDPDKDIYTVDRGKKLYNALAETVKDVEKLGE